MLRGSTRRLGFLIGSVTGRPKMPRGIPPKIWEATATHTAFGAFHALISDPAAFPPKFWHLRTRLDPPSYFSVLSFHVSMALWEGRRSCVHAPIWACDQASESARKVRVPPNPRSCDLRCFCGLTRRDVSFALTCSLTPGSSEKPSGANGGRLGLRKCPASSKLPKKWPDFFLEISDA